MNKEIKIEFNQLKIDVFSKDWELIKSSCERLGQIGGDEVVEFLISLILTEDAGIRNRASLALRALRDNRALEPLLTAIFRKENHQYNGTMVYALESLDCSMKLKELFRILFYQQFECKISAYAILDEQIFNFTIKDIIEIRGMWDDCKLNPNSCPGFENLETRRMMEDAYNGYIGYLTEHEKKNK